MKTALGRFGEDVAAKHLAEAGLTVLERNWRCPEGELDIVCRSGSSLVMVEVKTRTGTQFGSPAEAINHAKAARLRRLTARWIDAHRDDPAHPYWAEVRIDVVSVVRSPGGGVEVDHIVDAV